MQPAGVVGVGQPVDPLAGGGEQDPVPGLAGAHRQTDREVGFAGAGRAEEHDVVLGGDEVQGAEVGDEFAFEAAGVVEVELLERLAGGEPGRADAALAAVGLPGGDLALQAGGQELLVGPGLGAGPFGEPVDRIAQRRRFQRPGQNAISAVVSRPEPGRGGFGGGHQATAVDIVRASTPRAVS